VLESVRGIDNVRILAARKTVQKLIDKNMGVHRYISNDICVHDGTPEYEWRKIENAYLSGYTRINGKTFESFDEARDAAIKQSDAHGFTFDKRSKTYTLRVGNRIVKSKTEDSWMKILL